MQPLADASGDVADAVILEGNLEDGVHHAAGARGNGSEPNSDLHHEVLVRRRP